MFSLVIAFGLLAGEQPLQAGEACPCGMGFCNSDVCVDECPDGTYYNWNTKDGTDRACLASCAEETTGSELRVVFTDYISTPSAFKEVTMCGKTCPSDVPYEVQTDTVLECMVECPYDAKFISGQQCLKDKCPSDTTFWKYGELINHNISCTESSEEADDCYRLRICTKTCEGLYVAYETPSRCLAEQDGCPDKSDNGDFIQGKACVEKCGDGFLAYDASTRVCSTTCSGLYEVVTLTGPDSKSYSIKKCVSACTNVSYGGRCIPDCTKADGTDTPMFDQDKICVYSCKQGYVAINKTCTLGPCPSDAPLKKGFQCVTSCETKIEGFSELDNKWFVTTTDETTCVGECPSGQSYKSITV